MVPASQIIGMNIVHLIVCLLMAGGTRLVYYYQIQGFSVNATWKEQHRDDCGKLPFPSFFDKELLISYRFIFFNYGIALGYVLDSVLFNGTRIDYNQVRTSEGQSPIISFFIRFIITMIWVVLNLWLFQGLINLVVHKWFFLLAVPYFTMGLGIFGFLKYPFYILGATRPEIHPVPAIKAVELRRADRPFE